MVLVEGRGFYLGEMHIQMVTLVPECSVSLAWWANWIPSCPRDRQTNCLTWLPVAVIKVWPCVPWGQKGFIWLHIQIADHYEGQWGWTLEAETDGEALEAYRLLAFSSWLLSVCFLIQHSTACLGLGLLTVAWAFPHQSLIKKQCQNPLELESQTLWATHYGC